tara:strand:- start:337 stop:966 length:630 start_codon:yes stop_codon:yes gene_type:complete
MKKITIIDYGMGNIQSLYNVLKFLGYSPQFYSENNEINSNLCILPGVGAYNHAMELIIKKKIDYKIYNFLKNKNNFIIGICLGMQLLFNESEENMKTEGLKIIKGEVLRLSSQKSNILPNVGWFDTSINADGNHSYLNQFNKEKFYYVHSFYAQPSDIVNQIGTTNYYDKNFCAITIKNENIIGTQFHPEKSSKVGLDFFKSIIKNAIN